MCVRTWRSNTIDGMVGNPPEAGAMTAAALMLLSRDMVGAVKALASKAQQEEKLGGLV